MTRAGRFFTAALLLLATVGFTARLLSLLAAKTGTDSIRSYAVAVRLNPVDPDKMRRLGAAWLREGNVPLGIAWLERSLWGNPLSADAWMELGRAHLTDPEQRKHHFELGIAELRTAARLGPGRTGLSLAVGMELLRLWPLLDDDAREECRQRLSRGINHMRPGQVDEMVRDWYRYSRSWDLLASVLERCPDVCTRVARQMLELQAPLEWRWRLMDASERQNYARIRSQYTDLERSGQNVSQLEGMIREMDRIRGYARLVDPKNLDYVRYRAFREQLVFAAFVQSLRQFRRNPLERQRQEVTEWLKQLIFQTRTLDLADLPRRLNDVGLLRPDDPQSGIQRAHLDLRVGDHAGALDRARQLLPAMNGEPAVEAGLLAVRAAIAVRLMTLALQEVEFVLGLDPDNFEALWRRVQINRIIREDVSPQDIERLQNEAILEIGPGGQASARVPLVEGVRAAVSVPRSAVTEKRLLQVFLDGAILLEKYLGDEAETVWLDIPVPTEFEPMPNVEVKVLEVKSEK